MYFFNSLTQPKKDSFACYRCRIAKSDNDQSQTNTVVCPHCGRAMYNMGAGFIPPRQSDKDEWQKVALLVKHNFTFEYLSA